jgi:SAM-dependent methyltransferase
LRILPFIQYFFYLGYHWNWNIAFHIIVNEIRGEKKYGIQTTGSDELNKTKASGVDISHATVYMPANYALLEDVFNNLPKNGPSHFIDIGCGKGRAVCVAAHHGFEKVTGIDFSKEFCSEALLNLQQTQIKFPRLQFAIIHQDALLLDIPADADCLFFFNPFDQYVMQQVAIKLLESLQKSPRDIYIVYLNPLYKNEFLQLGFEEVFYTCKLKYLEAVILKKLQLTALLT